MGFDFGIKAIFGGDTSQLKASLVDAQSQLKGFKNQAEGMGLDLQKIALSTIFIKASMVIGDAITNTQKLRDEMEKNGQAVDINTASVARFGDGLDAVKEFAGKVIPFIISGWTMIGDTIGSSINRLRGVSEAQENIAVAINRDSEKNIAAIGRVAAANDQRLAKSLDAVAKKEEDLAAKRRNAYENQVFWLNRVGALELELAQWGEGSIAYNETKAKLLDAQGKLMEATAATAKQMAAEDKAAADTKKAATKDQTVAEKAVTEAIKEQPMATSEVIEAKQEVITYEQEQLAWEEKITDEIKKQNAAKVSGGKITTVGAEYSQQSTANLKYVLANLRDELADAQKSFTPGVGLSTNPMSAVILSEISKVENELGIRASAEALIRRYGEEGARERFSLGPDAFDRILSYIEAGSESNTQKIVDNLQKIRETLAGKYRNT